MIKEISDLLERIETLEKHGVDMVYFDYTMEKLVEKIYKLEGEAKYFDSTTKNLKDRMYRAENTLTDLYAEIEGK